MKLDAHQHLLDINVGFDRVLRGLAASRKHAAFNEGELEHLTAVSKQTQAATNSYLAEVIQGAETEHAGRLYRKRVASERADQHRT